MIKFDCVTKRKHKRTEHQLATNPWLSIKILIIGDFGSGKANASLILINHKLYTDKI